MVKQLDNRERLAEGAALADRRGHTVLVSRTRPIADTDPLIFFAKANRCWKGSRSFWMDPGRTLSLVGLGRTAVITGNRRSGEDRFAAAEREWKEWTADALIDGAGRPGTGPLLLGGFSFDPDKPSTRLWDGFQEASLVLPRWMLTTADDGTWLTVNCPVLPGTDPGSLVWELEQEERELLDTPEPDRTLGAVPFRTEEVAPRAWKRIVADAAREIRAGYPEKLVLARELRLAGGLPFSPETVLDGLALQQPDSFLFAVEREDACFLGASPERLVKRESDRLLSTCLAGTIARGSTPQEDRRLGEALLTDAKNREEHAVVVHMIREAFLAECDQVRVPDVSVLYKARDVQHLYTPVTGRARGGTSLLAMVGRLHPTPAVGGFPQEAAVAWIRGKEALDRGWYASPVGWVDAGGNGEFCVALRSGILRGDRASLFAGCGIVGESDPEKEYEETRWKFRPMLSALGDDGR